MVNDSVNDSVNTRTALADLFGADDFVGRHIGPTADEQAHMLRTIGAASLDALLAQTVPTSIRMAETLPMPGSRSVTDVLAELRVLADRNVARTSKDLAGSLHIV